MASQDRGFNQSIASLSHQTLRKQERKDLAATVASFKARLQRQQSRMHARAKAGHEPSVEDSAWLPNAVEFSRRVLLPTNQPLQIHQILNANGLYQVEGRALRKFQRNTLRAMVIEEKDEGEGNAVFTGEELVEQFQAVHNNIRSKIDRVTKFMGLTESMGATEDDVDAVRFIHRDGEFILNQFFLVCQVPNEAEELMLATVCNIHSVFIRCWFKTKRKANAKFFHAVATATNKGSLGELFRKQLERDAVKFC